MERRGKKSVAQTPAPKKDRIYGSERNPKGSASSSKSASKIELSESIINTLENKRDEYNAKHPNGKVTLATLKAVFRRGAGAYSSSHRPRITGGRPNSRSAWAFARVNKFLLKKGGTKVKAAYVQDDDLMERGGRLYHLGGDMSKHLAPNGKPSNLTHEQWHLVRTSEFKAWFGDWENDPENASKVVDENGEPLVVYHFSDIDFNIFELKGTSKGFFFVEDKYDDEFSAEGVIKSLDKGIIPRWLQKYRISEEQIREGIKESKYKVSKSYFLTIKKLNKSVVPNIYWSTPAFENPKILKSKFDNYDGIEFVNEVDEKRIIVAFEPNQIKLADGSNTTFDANNPDIRYEDGGLVNALTTGMENLNKNGIVLSDNRGDIIVIAYNTGNQEVSPSLYNKSLIYKSVQPIKSANEIIQNFDFQDFEMFSEDKMEEYKKSHLILLNQNEVVYDSKNADIRFDDGGKVLSSVRKFYDWFINWYKDGKIYEKMNISISIPNEFTKIDAKADSVILDLFEKIDQNIDAKKYMEQIISKADNFGVSIYLEAIPRYKYINSEYKKEKISSTYLIDYYKQFGFQIIGKALMKRTPKSKLEYGGNLGQEITCVNCGWNWNTSQSDEFDKYICHKCGFDNRTYYDSEPIGKYHLGGDMSKHLAPNGKPSKLNHEQWHLVRTPEFKAWFGDWENDPENASKVVDQNGEPKVYYQGHPYSEYPEGKNLYEKENNGIFFTASKKIGLTYGMVKSVFINSRNPKDIRNYYGYDNKKISASNRNDNKYWYKKDNEKEYLNSDPNVIKFYEDVIDKYGNKVLKIFDRTDGVNEYKNKEEIKDFLIQTSKKGFKFLNFKHKSSIWDLVAKYIKDSQYDGLFATDEDKLSEDIADSVVVYDSNQIKLADGTNTTFNANNPDIRYKNGGNIENELLKKAPSVLKIADKHNVDLETVDNALKKGIKVEMEHTKNKNVAKTIALHHLYESPKYYEKLKEMEKELNLDEHYDDIRKIYNIGGVVDPVLSFSTPTGEPSKLTYLQQVLVRTNAFKKFFGDWEYAGNQFVKNGRQEYEYLYRNVSKVIDKITLEPKVVYHGTRVDSEFFVFDVSQQSGLGRPYGYFAHNMEYSANFTSSQMGITNGQPFLYKCFVNIRNPFYAMTSEYYDIQEDAQYWKNEISKTIALDKYNNELDANKLKTIKDVVESQIGKYIDDTFRSSEASFWVLMARDSKKLFKYFLNNYRYDGVFYAEEFSNNYDVDNPAEFTEAVTIFEPSQVKLADGRNLNFDPMNVDIRYEKGGDTDNVENTEEKYNVMGKRENLRNLLLGDKYAEGGEVVANKLKDGNDGKKGGYFEGRSHAQGGIKAYNKDTGQMIEVEGEEVIITKGAVKDQQKREFEGEMLTNREILSRINQSGGGVSFARGGEMGGSSCGCSGKKYKYGGEMMDDYSIVRIMNKPFEIINDNFADARAFADMLVNKLK